MRILDLIKSGKLKVGQELIWNSRSGVRVCKITQDGFLVVESGNRFKTPSGAAKYFNGGRSVDGWLVWKIKDTSSESYIKIGDLRS